MIVDKAMDATFIKLCNINVLYQLCIKLCKRIDYLNSTHKACVGGSNPPVATLKPYTIP